MKFPDAWWRIPRPIRRAILEPVAFAGFLFFLVVYAITGVIEVALQALCLPVRAYHAWQFHRVNLGLRRSYEANGKKVELFR